MFYNFRALSFSLPLPLSNQTKNDKQSFAKVHVLIVPTFCPVFVFALAAAAFRLSYIVIELFRFLQIHRSQLLQSGWYPLPIRHNFFLQYLLQNSKLHFQLGIYRTKTTRKHKNRRSQESPKNQRKAELRQPSSASLSMKKASAWRVVYQSWCASLRRETVRNRSAKRTMAQNAHCVLPMLRY